MSKTLLTFATICLLHAAFSTYEHLSQLKALDRPQDHPLPHDVSRASKPRVVTNFYERSCQCSLIFCQEPSKKWIPASVLQMLTIKGKKYSDTVNKHQVLQARLSEEHPSTGCSRWHS
ncbi:hypothetical protein K439DRAFT_127558 [Ramaria rubella]|nr:hypothetical protein K439DRAFT_127558 [Ramaria rubella]